MLVLKESKGCNDIIIDHFALYKLAAIIKLPLPSRREHQSDEKEHEQLFEFLVSPL